jgi:hypothetical protein
MPLKITKVTNISPEFLQLVQTMYSEWMTRNQGLIQRGISDKRYDHYAYTAKRMLPIVRGISPSAREGVDYELTRFRGLPYTDFVVVTGPYPGGEQAGMINWLVGRTKHVTATYFDHRNEIAGELGRYDVYIPETIVAHPDLGHIHMVPQRNQLSVNRHYHHYLNISEERAPSNPLALRTGNCWGSYSTPLKGLMDEPDFPELFRQLYNHLSTYGYAPPRTSLDFDTSYKD